MPNLCFFALQRKNTLKIYRDNGGAREGELKEEKQKKEEVIFGQNSPITSLIGEAKTNN
jgi:hypothetical protein